MTTNQMSYFAGFAKALQLCGRPPADPNLMQHEWELWEEHVEKTMAKLNEMEADGDRVHDTD